MFLCASERGLRIEPLLQIKIKLSHKGGRSLEGRKKDPQSVRHLMISDPNSHCLKAGCWKLFWKAGHPYVFALWKKNVYFYGSQSMSVWSSLSFGACTWILVDQVSIHWVSVTVLFCSCPSHVSWLSLGFVTVSSMSEFVNSESYSFSSFFSITSCGCLLPSLQSLCDNDHLNWRILPFEPLICCYLWLAYNVLSCGCLTMLHHRDFYGISKALAFLWV